MGRGQAVSNSLEDYSRGNAGTLLHARRQPRLAEVSERPSGAAAGGGPAAAAEAVTALCFGQHGGGSLLMLSGHASGALKVWELKSHLTGGLWVMCVGWILVAPETVDDPFCA